jgi:N-methylhydantoinase B/oxoprolinase/acetone carboxylase alpha subunit
LQSSGGGGWGEPAKRTAASIQSDSDLGLVSD